MMAAILKTEPAPLAADTPAELQRLVRKSLQKDPNDRYQTAKDLLIDLNALKQELNFTAELERSGIPTRADQSAPTQDQIIHTTSSAEYIASGIRHHKGTLAVALAVLLFAVLGLAYWYYNHRSSNTTQIESIAVLPFKNESGNTDLEYLSDGMTDTLINSLAKLPRLTVKARSSVFHYKGKEVEPQQAASELSVQEILSGRVVQRGDDLTLYLSLIDGRNGNQVWGEKYDRKLTDLVTLQSEIARDVSQMLRARLSSADEQNVAKIYTANPEAYQLYLKGRYQLYEGNGDGYKRSLEYFQQAIEKDPNYAQAYAGIAGAYIEAADVYLSNREAMAKARTAATKALELDDALAEGHMAMAGIRMWYDWNWPETEKEFRRAIELNPNYTLAHQGYSFYLGAVRGQYSEAIVEAKLAQQIDPLSLYANGNLGYAFLIARQYDAAIEQLHNTLKLDQNYSWAHGLLGDVYTLRGQFPEATAEYQRAMQLDDAIGLRASLAIVYAQTGKRAEAQKTLDELKSQSGQRFVSEADVAEIYAFMGQRDQAIEWLEKSYEARSGAMILLKRYPMWDALRSDPRFQALIQKIGFPE